MNAKYKIVLLMLLFSSSLFAEKKVIAVYPFKNITKNKNYEYLKVSISEAIITSVSELKRFTIIKANMIEETLKKNKIKISKFSVTEATNLSKKLKADIFIYGTFLAVKNKIQINGRIYSVSTGEILAGAKVKSKITSSIFDALDELSEKLAKNLDKAIPKEKVITKIVYKDRIIKEKNNGNFSLFLAPEYFIPVAKSKDFVSKSLGFSLGFGYNNLFFKNTYLGLCTGYSNQEANNNKFSSLSVIPINLKLGYQFYFFKKLIVMPYFTGGLLTGKVSGGKKSIIYILSNSGIGFNIAYPIWEKLHVFISNNYYMHFSSEVHPFYTINLGLLYKGF